MGFDIYYIYLIIPAMLLAFWASINVKGTFSKYSRIPSKRGFTGRDAALAVLDRYGITDVQIVKTSGELTDHFDPSAKVIRLSESVYSGTSAASIGVAAHEAGHAAQYAEDYVPMKLRSAIIPATRIGSNLAMPLFLIGLVMSAYGEQFLSIAYIGIFCFSLSTLFQLLTLPAELNASSRALAAIKEEGILDREEYPGAKRVLRAAALTYVAALAVSLLQLLKLLAIAGSRKRR